jgi:hypothetical protein
LLPRLLPRDGSSSASEEWVPKNARSKRVSAPDGTVVVRGKAPNGVGSVYPLAGGSWRATWTDRSGRRRFIRGSTHVQVLERREAAQLADERATDAARTVPNRFSPLTTTVNEVADWWLGQQRHRVRASSIGKYADRIDRFRMILGSEIAAELTAEQVASWQSQLLDRLSPKTAADTRSTLVSVLGAAQDLGLVSADVAQRVKPPRVPKSGGRAITPDEVRTLLAATSEHRLGAVTVLDRVDGGSFVGREGGRSAEHRSAPVPRHRRIRETDFGHGGFCTTRRSIGADRGAVSAI